jgi:hypothetical protein
MSPNSLTSTLLAILAINSACVLFILVHRTDIATTVAFEILPHLRDISHAADATRFLCGKRVHHHGTHMPNATAFDQFPAHELVSTLQRSEAMLLFALTHLQAATNILVLGESLDAARVFLDSANPDTTKITVVITTLTAAATAHMLRAHPNLRIASAGPEHFIPEGRYDIVYFDGTEKNVDRNTRTLHRLTLAINCLVLVHGTGTHAHMSPGQQAWDATTTAKDAIEAERSGQNAVTTNKGAGIVHSPELFEFAERIVSNDPTWTKVDLMSARAWRHGVSVLQVKRAMEDEDY